VKIAFVYAFWLIDGAVDHETRSILKEKRDDVFTKAGVNDPNVKLFFDRIMSDDNSILPAAPASGPLSSKMKLLETISRIVDLVNSAVHPDPKLPARFF
jgi:hypothetical protein